MSVVCENTTGWVLDHSSYVEQIYSNVEVDVNLQYPKQLCLKKDLFQILTPFLWNLEAKNYSVAKKGKRKRSHGAIDDASDIGVVKAALDQLVSLAIQKDYFISSPDKETFLNNNESARECSSLFFNTICQQRLSKCSGGNTSKVPLVATIQGQSYLIPEESQFHCCNLQELNLNETKYDLILVDPPWWNKYVRRCKSKQESAGYKMMFNEDVEALPIKSWLSADAMVAVWCTNCVRHVEDVVNRWFPKWGLEHGATWYWVKVTRSGQPVCQFSPRNGKQPFERILFGAARSRKFSQPPDQRCIVSVPSAIHSHKPPLSVVLQAYLPQEPRCLELFARYLLPRWTSAGDQVLALQNLKLYSELKSQTYIRFPLFFPHHFHIFHI